MTQRKNLPKQGFHPDYLLLLAMFALLSIGVAMIYSGVFYPEKLPNFQVTFHDKFAKHVFFVILGLGLFFVCSILPIWTYRTIAKLSFFFAIILLVLVLIFGWEVQGAKRWLALPKLPFKIQPAEFAKISLILFLAQFIEKREKYIKSFKRLFLPAIFWIFIVSGLVILEPSISNAILIILIGTGFLYLVGTRLVYIVGTYLAVALLSVALFFTSNTIDTGITNKVASKFQHAQERFEMYQHPEKNLQVVEAKIGIAKGGILGTGIGKGKVKFRYLPFVTTDFVFALIGEELGLIGIIVVVGLFLTIGFRGMSHAVILLSVHRMPFLGYLAAGLTWMIVVSGLIHMFVVLGILPPTGLPLPLVSYGGSNLLINLAALGFLVRLSHISNTGDVKL